MPIGDHRDDVDREILDIIPERFDSDPDGRGARKSAHTRLALTIALALLAVAALGVAARHILFGEQAKTLNAGAPVVHADDRPVKTRPQDRGGMDVPNQDKLVYERMSGNAEGEPQAERLLPPPEQPQAPQRKPAIKPAFSAPNAPATGELPPAAAPAPAAPNATTAPNTPAVPAMTAPAMPAVPAAPPAAPAKTAAAPPAAPAKAVAAPPAPLPQSSAPAAKPAAVKPPVAGAATTSSAGGWLVQLAALTSEGDARNEWSRVRGANKDLLGELSSDIVRVDLGAKGIFWRLRAGPLAEAEARTLCAALTKRSQGCIVARK